MAVTTSLLLILLISGIGSSVPESNTDTTVPENISEGSNTDTIVPENISKGSNADTIVPENISKVSNADTIVPENISKGSNTDTIVPENVSEGSNTDTNVPENISEGSNADTIVPEYISKGSNTDTIVHENTSEGSNTDTIVPENISKGSNTDTIVPENASEESNSATIVPENTSEGSKNTTAVPGQTFKEAEKEVVDFVNQQIRALLPRVVGRAGTTSLSQKCTAGMMKIIGNIRKLKVWTLKLIDSIGKPTSGMLKGTHYSFGHYDQCVDLMVTGRGHETLNQSEAIFQGMYCRVRIQFSDAIERTARDYYKGKINASDLGRMRELIQASPHIPVSSVFLTHFLGICLPSSCTEEDVRQIFRIIPFPGSATLEGCEIKSGNEDLNKTQMIVMIIFIILISLVCVTTFIDWLLHSKSDNMATRVDKRCVSVTVAFSFCNNNKLLFRNVEDDANHALAGHCVRGIVVASVAWVILGFTYLLPYDAFYMQSSSLENLKTYFQEQYFAHVVNYPLGIDALFVCYGFILTYTLWYTAYKNQEVKANVVTLIVQNYLRILIPVLLCLGVSILLPFFGSGPFWNNFVDNTLSKCSKNIWAYVGMYSNFLDPHELCYPHLWFPSCLAQLTLVAIILCWVLSRNMKLGIMILVILTLAGNVSVGIYTYINDFEPSYVAYFAYNSSDLFWKLNYALPLTHIGPYAIGMLTGIVVARRSGQIMSKLAATVGWILCLSVLEGLMLFIYKYHMDTMNIYWSALYAGCHRTVFAFCVAWVILACSFGGFLNSLFSWRIFDPLYKLSYYSYIISFVIISFTVSVSREHFYYSHLDMVLKAISYICVSYIASYFLYMLLESPLKSLCSAICGRKSREINVSSINNFHLYRPDTLSTCSSTIEGSCKLWSVSTTSKSALMY